MKKYTIYNGIENLTAKQINTSRAEDKRAVTSELANFANSIEYAYKQLTASTSQARNAANAAKGYYKTAVAMVAACYPYQAAAAGTYEVKIKDGTSRRRFERGALLVKTADGYKIRRVEGRADAFAEYDRQARQIWAEQEMRLIRNIDKRLTNGRRRAGQNERIRSNNTRPNERNY